MVNNVQVRKKEITSISQEHKLLIHIAYNELVEIVHFTFHYLCITARQLRNLVQTLMFKMYREQLVMCKSNQQQQLHQQLDKQKVPC